ncbi:hypothetical protein F441_14170 [Phytophthora nicotianae CJ01A1]|uniref:Uncharacterized protein n=6 Tax=Phytophthora nicotianae TaxID=4792 RepID=W2PWA1_PHYN3|nr:hypothetical protein PPTG_14662 [Phytophthora nicotianae INRA-310]ETI40310.1 hypothetical protein F443_14274 [Phytophthora nicotianae P1569]ETL87118.1 hypothetical protein L917_13610 [Phytophthora nicotianae]ETO69009.1 hypothetical protein F444_14290 [Phytophthora nicotianae P1976]ETP10129.1 hypothetical protein F441_14170 [Phytophthora nicotianae CJ01A1]ETP38215.1 hypothetical protein F442_14116 [Phytophthora nicotianae P10297]
MAPNLKMMGVTLTLAITTRSVLDTENSYEAAGSLDAEVTLPPEPRLLEIPCQRGKFAF